MSKTFYFRRLIDKESIVFLDLGERDDVLRSLAETAASLGKIQNQEEFTEALFAREKIVSTGIGAQVAIPHAKIDAPIDFFFIIGVLRRGVPWGSLDNVPVRLVFLIGGPQDEQKQYLHILSRLTSVIREESVRRKILLSRSQEEVYSLFVEQDPP